jgi:diguanylate cyclase (GGDEF)-like protein
MRLQTKITGGFFAMLLITTAVGIFSYTSIQNALKPLNETIPQELEALEWATELGGLVHDIRYYEVVSEHSLHDFLLHRERLGEQRYYAFRLELERTVQMVLDKVGRESQPLFVALDKSQIALSEMQGEVLRLMEQENPEQAIALLRSDRYQEQRQITLNVIRDFFLKRGIHYRDALVTVRISAAGAKEVMQQEGILLTTAIGAGLVLLTLMVMLISQTIITPLHDLSRVTEEVGNGRLDTRVDQALLESGDEIGQLAQRFDRMMRELAESDRSLKQEQRILKVVDAILAGFIGQSDVETVFDSILIDVLRLSDSQYGFINQYRNDEGTPYLQALAISNITWNAEMRRFCDEHAKTGFRFHDRDTLYTVSFGEVVIANDLANHPNSKGLSEGQLSLDAFLGVPLKRGDRIVGCVGLANRQDGYDVALVERLAPLWSALAQVVDARYAEETRQVMERRNEQLAYYDVLSGLPNRVSFNERLGWAIRQSRRYGNVFALLLLDLDHFKDVNDTLGHLVGDALLVAVAKRLTSALRESDVVARLGGDEFAVLGMGLKAAKDAAVCAQRVVDLLAQPFDIDGHQIHTGASIGITLYDGGDGEPEKLLGQADTALYRVKEEGRGGYRFHDIEMEADVRYRVTVIGDLRRAIDEDQFTLFFQPQINAREQRLVGVEALIRWEHPERGFVPPNNFIPVAEQSGQLLAIDDWVLREACRQMRAWQEEGLLIDGMIAVNMSPLAFKRDDFEQKIISVLDESGIEPSCLELEVTESVLAQRPEEIAGIMKRLGSHGVRFSIDDFGTGYSSMQYLKSLPVHKIKIAHEFVWEMLSDASDASIVKAIIGLSRDLGHEVIAEGVETQGQLEFLLRENCHLFQGYYFSRPQPANKFAAWARHRETQPV